MPEAFRDKLKAWRSKLNIGQKTAADLLGLKVRTYMCYEQGVYEPSLNPSRAELEKRMIDPK